MNSNFNEIPGRIQIVAKQKLKELIKNYYFYEFSNVFDIFKMQKLFQNIKISEIAIITVYKTKDENAFFIISFHNTIIIIKISLIGLLAPLFYSKSELKFYFLQDTKNIFNEQMRNTNFTIQTQIECDKSIDEEINNFNDQIHNFTISNFEYREMYSDIKSSISRYLIQESYNKLNKEQIVDFSKDFVIKPPEEKKMDIEQWDGDEYIELKNLGSGRSSIVKLMFQIENQSLFAIKMQNENIQYESENYRTREYKNYLQLNYPLLPKLYGVYKFENNYYLKIQFINGQTLDDLDELKLTFVDKVFIIFQLMLIINHFHEKGLVYRDLKPNNIVVDFNKTVFVIDFDRMISEKADISDEQDHTKDFSHDYVAPEVNKGQITPKNDIYSLGKIIEYIIGNDALSIDAFSDENPNNRPSIYETLKAYYLVFATLVNRLPIQYIPEIQYIQGYLSIEYDIYKSIHYLTLAANQNHPKAQHSLGAIYYEGQYITRDIQKSIHYYTLAANQNHTEAQFNLGVIYYFGQYITRDIKKAIHYLTLAANQNYPLAQFNLGVIYQKGQYITQDIPKSIHYLTLAANQNYPLAQYQLGLIYYTGEYITRDIKKSIHYYTLAANQNIPQAQVNLGAIYYAGEYITRNINKSIQYYTLAANQNIPQAQFNLGLIYYEGQYITRDIQKSIHYYTLAANQNYSQAQFNLGLIYYEGQYITRDINKSIQYFTLAANQNDPQAQYNLGVIYYLGQYITRDINKSIYYLTLAANQNYPLAQFNLGAIYYSGKYITQDIQKSIHYYTLAANQNIPQAQFNLGLIYYSGEYITRDINKSIQYYTLAANQNHPQAQYNLGLIYYEGQCTTRDINKSIQYFTLSANQNIPEAQFILGVIYYSGEYITRDINKSIQYFTLAANRNYPQAQFILGVIYYSSEYITRDINKSVKYLTLAANQNDPKAQYNLGVIYYSGQYITRDINKSIQYFTLAANQNDPEAQLKLGLIYYSGQYITRDIQKSIHYFTLAANQNISQAQNNLGFIYEKGEYITRDIKKSIHYYTLAANQNDPEAQFNLGLIYYLGEYITRDINKSIHYFTLAANQNIPQAQFNLGAIYYSGEYITRDINKSIHYFTLAANQNDPKAQYSLGLIYLINKNTNIGINYLDKSSSAGNIEANFVIGYLYHEGKYIDRNMSKCIKHYKYASSFNNFYAKNNLGVIYKNGIGDEIPKNIGYAIEYFSEAVRRWKDKLSMYNLAHIYIYEIKTDKKLNESIELLIKSSNQNFFPSKFLLCIALINKHKFDIEKIQNELTEKSEKLVTPITQLIISLNLLEKSFFELFKKGFETVDYLYDFLINNVQSNLALNQKNIRDDDKKKNISQEFYEGFGSDI